jgi:site-specific recombinase XerD
MKFDEVAQLQWTQVNFQAHIIRLKGKGNKER